MKPPRGQCKDSGRTHRPNRGSTTRTSPTTENMTRRMCTECSSTHKLHAHHNSLGRNRRTAQAAGRATSEGLAFSATQNAVNAEKWDTLPRQLLAGGFSLLSPTPTLYWGFPVCGLWLMSLGPSCLTGLFHINQDLIAKPERDLVL